MINNYERNMIDAFSIKKYFGSDLEKRSLVEIASAVFIATDINLGNESQKQENFSNAFSELIGTKTDESIPMNIMIAAKKFGLNADLLMDYSKVRMLYEARKDKFNQAFMPICAYARAKYPELGMENINKTNLK